jgi:actin-like ATPase involved in cell morphogenesis
MVYALGVDLGTTFTAAAVSDRSGTRMVSLGASGTVPSVVFAANDGTLLTGEAADRAARIHPERASRSHKRRLGDPIPQVLGGTTRPHEVLIAAQLRDVCKAVVAREGREPGSIVLTCPAVWGPYRREHFAKVPGLAGLSGVRIITEPEAAASHYAAERRLGDGELVAVYDLGGGTFDTTVLRATRDGMEILGTPEGIEHMGGIDFDLALLAHVDKRLGGAISALDEDDPSYAVVRASALANCVQAKEVLSTATTATVRVSLPDGDREIEVTRQRFAELIRPLLTPSIEAVDRTLASAGVTTFDLAAVLLAGGSSRIPLVQEVVSSAFNKPVHVGLHPKLTVALGAAAIAHRHIDHPVRIAPPSRTRTPSQGTMFAESMTAAPPRRPGAIVEPFAAQTTPPGMYPRTAPGTGTSQGHHRPHAPQQFSWARGRVGWVVMGTAAVVLTIAGAITVRSVINAPSDAQRGAATAATGGSALQQSAATMPTVFFDEGHDQRPFTSRLGSDQNWAGVALTPEGTGSLNSISVVPSDVNGKLDGRRIRWDGRGAGQYYLQSPTSRVDARPYLDKGALVFDLIVHSPPSDTTSLAAHCHFPCAGQVEVTELLRQPATQQRRTIAVPVRCFSDRGLDPSVVDTPFLLLTAGTLDLSIARVRWAPDAAGGTDAVRCDELR